jgi:hypothetical protein
MKKYSLVWALALTLSTATGRLLADEASAAFGGRTGAIREKLLREGGGNARSEAAVAAGLKWLASRQAEDGHWALDADQKDDTVGTALALLPFLGSGETHRAAGRGRDDGDVIELLRVAIDKEDLLRRHLAGVHPDCVVKFDQLLQRAREQQDQ